MEKSPRFLESEENLGALYPIGSKIELVQKPWIKTLFECWDRISYDLDLFFKILTKRK